MRVAVLGAGGTIAPAIVRDLADSTEVTELALLDLDADRASAVAEAHGMGKAASAAVDARRNGALAEALAGADVLVNSASYRVNLEAMRAAVAVGCHYLDLGGLYWMTARQLELSAEFDRAGVLALLGIGSAPGKTNLMAAAGVGELGGEPVDAIDVSAAGRDLDPPAGESFPYALQTLLDEVTMRPVAVSNGEPGELEPLADGGVIDFGEPIGPAASIHTLHSEMLTFPPSFGCRRATFRLALSPAVEQRLRELATASPEEVAAVAAAAVPPSPRTVSVHLVEVRAGERVVRVRSVTPPHSEWGLGGGIVSTATPVGAAVRLLASGRIDATGAHPPERCIDPAPMFAELRSRGVRFELQTLAAEEVGA
jgi:lysine 6-dehydrogenase